MTQAINEKMMKIFKSAKYDTKAKKWRMKEKKINKLVKEVNSFVIENFHDLDDEMLHDLGYTITLGLLEQVLIELELYI